MSEEEKLTGTSNKSNNEEQEKENTELSDLLASALKDFSTQLKNEGDESGKNESSERTKPTPPDSLWDDEFLKQLTETFEKSVNSFIGEGDTPSTCESLVERIQSLAEAATQGSGGEASPVADFSNIISQTLKSLSENAENIQNPVPEDCMNILGKLNSLSDSSIGDTNELMPFFLPMMQGLLSKDILYPSLTNIIEKYTKWIEDNKSQLSTEELEQYSKQLGIMKEVCSELEKETDGDSPEVKNARFNRLITLMSQMQDCGQLPSDLVGDDMNARSGQATSPGECNLM